MSVRRGSNSTDSRHYYKWLIKARQDLRTVQILRAYGGDGEIIAFHCQQAIEKALKGYLLYRTDRHYDGHNLTFLCRQAAKVEPKFYQFLDESAALNRYYIESRYPTDLPFEISDGEVETIYGMAVEMYNTIRLEVYEPTQADDEPDDDVVDAEEKA